jgi:hypothetical protein
MAAALAANARPEANHAVIPSNELRITVYDQAHLPRSLLLNALDRLRLILQQAKISSNPTLGDPADPEASLFLYVALPSSRGEPRMACGARRDIALKILDSSPGSLPEGVLGMSSPFALFGLNVRIFNDHIYKAAFRHNLPHATVLPYAIAHEIGHVLLMGGSHGRRGLMSGVWTEREYQQMAAGALVFSEDEARMMAANLGERVCLK